ncbi:predicted protein [Sparassis crispa]|uniref:Anaphase-promoting complex subunit 5 n=1 Tax=Sparassis crispa TaxID=139825 RepID=A0A401GJ71_9APHY|nr:predicted protein [Sparassis crispa]GBE82222.1 predicted protein [Sparassis crispa]
MQRNTSSATPPRGHVLRPHHILLLRIIVSAFQVYEEPPLPPPFLLHLYRLILNEIAEVTQPRSYNQLLGDISRGPLADLPPSQKFLDELKQAPHELQTPQQLANYLAIIPSLYPTEKEDDDETDAPFGRRSLFGYFCRRCYVSFVKLSFGALARLQSDYVMWANEPITDGRRDPGSSPGYQSVLKDRLTNDYQIFKTKTDKKHFPTAEAYAVFEKAQAVGDVNMAAENLRRFFEQGFHEGSDSGLRQHALLNLARLHYVHHEYSACRKYLQEAVGAARTSGDKLTLQHCISMLHRLPPLERGRKYDINEIQPDLHPLEILYDVNKLMQIGNQPLAASFEKIVQAIGLFDHWIDVQRKPFVEAEQWGQHTVQSVVWSMHGCTEIGKIEQNIVSAFTEVGGADHNRLIVTLNRAYQRARQGKYQNALALLLEPDVWRGITLNDYNLWATEVWHIFVLRASRRGQLRQFSDFLKQKRPDGTYKAREYWFWSASSLGSMIRDPLYEVMQMRGVEQAHACVEQLLTAVWHAEFQCRYGLYRTAIVLLADIGLEFGMTKWCRRIIDEIMPQVITGTDLEQRGLACFTLARCIIAAGESSPTSLQECIPYLQIAEKDYAALEMFRSLQDVQYLLSVVYHNLGMTAERDEAATRHLKTEEEGRNAAVVVVEVWIAEVLEVVAEVGAGLASR